MVTRISHLERELQALGSLPVTSSISHQGQDLTHTLMFLSLSLFFCLCIPLCLSQSLVPPCIFRGGCPSLGMSSEWMLITGKHSFLVQTQSFLSSYWTKGSGLCYFGGGWRWVTLESSIRYTLKNFKSPLISHQLSTCQVQGLAQGREAPVSCYWVNDDTQRPPVPSAQLR